MHDKGGNAQQKCHNARAACNGIPVKGLIPNRPGTHKKSLFTGFFLFEHNVVGFHQWTESGEALGRIVLALVVILVVFSVCLRARGRIEGLGKSKG